MNFFYKNWELCAHTHVNINLNLDEYLHISVRKRKKEENQIRIDYIKEFWWASHPTANTYRNS